MEQRAQRGVAADMLDFLLPPDEDSDADLASTMDEVDSWSTDEDEAEDTTAEQLKQGRDVQGIMWERLQFSRQHYRETRLKQYRNYTNVLPDDANEYREDILKGCKMARKDGRFFDFVRNSRAVQSNIVHFQLRNLVWAPSRNDVFVTHDNCINHWSPVTRKITEVMNLAGGGRNGNGAPGVGRVQVSTLCVKDGIIAAGGFSGELVCRRLDSSRHIFSGRVTHSENGITNGIEVFQSPQHGTCIMAANNDCMLRVFEAEGFRPVARATYPYAVNYATMRPESSLVAVVGDDPVTQLTDIHSGAAVATLHAHKDYSFAAAWHPNGNMLATGNQDTTTVVWDVRYANAPLATLPGRMGAIRSLRFSPDGRFLAMAEPADFVHLYDVASGFEQLQEIDVFGEIAGISFTPYGDAFFVAIADITYSSLLEYDLHHPDAGASGAPFALLRS